MIYHHEHISAIKPIWKSYNHVCFPDLSCCGDVKAPLLASSNFLDDFITAFSNTTAERQELTVHIQLYCSHCSDLFLGAEHGQKPFLVVKPCVR